jgi:putative SOS response-associated peptidase YedK
VCERFAIPDQFTAEREFLPRQVWWKFDERFNVAAPQYVPAIRMHDGQSEAVMMRWGFIPAWAEGKPTRNHARRVSADRIDRSNTYRGAWLEGQRCILPLAGYYEWQLTPAGHRQPYFVRVKDRPVFGVAGIWDRSVSEEDDVIESCAVICVPANDLLKDIATSGQRMPAILKRKDYEVWLSATPAEAKLVLRPYRSDWMQAYPVSPRINSATADDPGLISPLR